MKPPRRSADVTITKYQIIIRCTLRKIITCVQIHNMVMTFDSADNHQFREKKEKIEGIDGLFKRLGPGKHEAPG